MSFVDEWMRSACESAEVEPAPFDREKSMEIVDKAVRKHGLRRTYGDIVKRLHASVSFQHPNAWQAVGDYPHDGWVFCFSDAEYGRSVYAFDSLNVLSKVLGKCPASFYWYVVDPDFTFLLAEDRDDYFVGSGAATEWVQKAGEASGSTVLIRVYGV